MMRLPINNQLAGYNRKVALDDLLAGSITAVLLVPQAIAYALLAGLPAEYGLYASVLPVAIYALLGSSHTLSVGPVAVAALMVNEALKDYAGTDTALQLEGAALLSAIVGLMLLALSAIRGGAVVRFISRPVLSGFVSGAALLIILSQVFALVGASKSSGIWASLFSLFSDSGSAIHMPTALMGFLLIVTLILGRKPLVMMLTKRGVSAQVATVISRLVPAFLTLLSAFMVFQFSGAWLAGVRTVGELPSGFFSTLPRAIPDWSGFSALIVPAAMIATIAYVESISVAKSLASRRGQRVSPDAEMRAIGTANLAASVVGTMPVAGGFSRSVVNFDAGAKTQMAGLITAFLVALAAFGLGDFFIWLPNVVLAAIIIIAVWQLVEWKELRQLWASARVDAWCFIATAIGVLVFGVEVGLLGGVVLSMAHFLISSSKPHIAVVGRVGRTEHFRNIERYQVHTKRGLLMIRIDENLVFTNAEAVEQYVLKTALGNIDVTKVVLVMSSVSRVDATAVHMLSSLYKALQLANIELAFAEVKGPVQDTLSRFSEEQRLHCITYLSANDAFESYIEASTFCDAMPQC